MLRESRVMYIPLKLFRDRLRNISLADMEMCLFINKAQKNFRQDSQILNRI
jgi:hypothetical protein